MMTECKQKKFEFQGLGKRKVVADFKGGTISSDAGALLLREIEKARGWIHGFARCFTDYRNPDLIEHSKEELVAQRIYGLALGNEDLNDHDLLRADPLLAVLCGKENPTGEDRRCKRDKGKALAGKSTLNRLELTTADANKASRYKKIVYDEDEIADWFVEMFLNGRGKEPEQLMIDFDATDDPLHGKQEGRFFHGYYGCYCYLPLYIFCGDELLCAKLRPSGIDASEGALEEAARIVSKIRRKWPNVRIILRGDSGFAREELMAWCEANGVDYIFGLAQNARLRRDVEKPMRVANVWHHITGQPVRVFRDFKYQTLKSWSRKRRVIGKAEYLEKGPNPRFVVTSLSAEEEGARELYEVDYCARGDMENRIKEQQLYLFADRTSSAMMRANQLRLYFSSLAYVLLSELRRRALAGTQFAKAQCHTIRLKLLKIGAQVRVSVRRVSVSFASSYPYQGIFFQIVTNLKKAYPQLC